MTAVGEPRLLSFRGNVLFGVSLVILILLALVSRRDQAEYRAAQQELENVRSTLQANSALLSKVTDAETGQRGYLLTGKQAYLKPYLDAVRHLDAGIVRLRNLAANQPYLRGAVAELIPLVHEKMEELKLSILVRGQRGAGPALELVNTDKGHEVMNRLRAVSEEIETAGQTRSGEIYSELTARAAMSRKEIAIGCVALFLLVATGALQIARDMARQRRLVLELAASEERYRKLASELEARVRQRTKELEDSNRELESFSYSVSHDLRAPLRAISGFSHMLDERAGPHLDPEEHELLGRMMNAARRMSELIDDLLKLSRTGRAPLDRMELSLTGLVQTIVLDLRQSHPEHPVQTVIAENVRVSADPRLLRTALENLLENAWKFTRRTPDPRVEFGVQANGDVPVYYVRDNGAGFNMEHAANLFAPFQRLHSAREFEGTGIGLATVQRIIQRHGGRVWAEAKPDQGATFYFTLSN
jgi:signal transduction histidine kinase